MIDQWLDPAPGHALAGVVNWTPMASYGIDAHAFEEAATRLAGGWQDSTDDALIKVILYLYRHAIELQLKDAIHIANMCVDSPYQELDKWYVRTAKHNLRELRERLVELLSRNELFPDDPVLEEDSPEGRLLTELHEIDPKGDEFRFPLGWDNRASETRRARMPGGVDVVGRCVLLDVERMSADLRSVSRLIGSIRDRVYEERLEPRRQQSE
ncbi:hypothetical protein [Cellulomonas phragmiteti]|uniref:hypothetical protein n=1 Tax=Cellulomonas phragmiteti TaxID=478780 RepID=UPI001940CA04|nr:hypothetical protein [Cellulomonas phragmiteti]